MLQEKLINFINESPTAFNATSNLKEKFLKHSFIELKEENKFTLEKGKKYFLTRNDSSLIAFTIGKNIQDNYKYNIVASHLDSPSFKIKPQANHKVDIYNKINVEGYGGMIMSTWLDRPLSFAGRVIINQDNNLISKVINIKEPVFIIPNVCIHFNRQINNGYVYNIANDMQPLVSQDKQFDYINDKISHVLNIEKKDIINYDLFLYNFEKGYLWGENNEFISSPRLDDLECAFIESESLIDIDNDSNINVGVFFDNEEVGSSSLQGANSDFLVNTLKRINNALNFSEEDFLCAVSKSFMISSDNAHAVHPNNPSLTDPDNKVYMNKGIVIKFNASQSYTSDGLTSAYMQKLCIDSNVPYQFFTNRADIRGGSTLGNISLGQLSLRSVDIGLGQLAMHSSFETAGSEDIVYLYEVLKTFYTK